MNIPKTIEVGFHQVDVIYPYIFTETNNRIGQTNDVTGEIHLASVYANKPVGDSQVIVSLMHEVIHQIDFKSNLHLFDDEKGEPNETKVDGLAQWLCMVLRDNQELLELFRKDDEPVKIESYSPLNLWDFFTWAKNTYEPSGSGSRYERRIMAIKELLLRMDKEDADANLPV